eukprot:m.132160 g.132160  ORF g.132160 m.132160 type:complete len:571 (-) comp9828_c0_seq1:170-1882(-)
MSSPALPSSSGGSAAAESLLAIYAHCMFLPLRALAALLVAIATLPASAAVQQPPSVVFILADDLGFNELGYQNTSRGLLTPNIDGLAASAVRLKQYYVQPICSPTRSALMTGRYTIRLGTQSNVIYWDTPWGISLNETFLPQHFQHAGYQTAMFGKWHLGMFRPEYMPPARGFDTFRGYLQGCGSAYTHIASCCTAGSATDDQDFVCKPSGAKDYRGYDWFHDNEPVLAANHTNSATLIRDAAVEYVHSANATQPFFLYLPFQNIHAPYTADAKYRELYDNAPITEAEKTLFGYISEVDDAIGHVIAALKRSGRYENTLIVFSSDNGAPPDGPDVDHKHGNFPGWIARNAPYRGWKGLIWEGGTRVAGFIHSPGLLPAAAQNRDLHDVIHVTDWLPTLLHAAGISPNPETQPFDGIDFWPCVVDPHTACPRQEVLYGLNPLLHGGQAASPKAALRMGDFKLLTWGYTIRGVDGANQTGPVNAPPEANVDPGLKKGPLLFNLASDPAETTNLAELHPDVVAKLLARLAELAVQSVQPMQWDPPYQGPDYFCANCPKHPGGSGPEVPWLPWL